CTGAQRSALSSYDPIRPVHHRLRNRETDLLGRFEVDNQLELCWLFNGEVGGLGVSVSCPQMLRRGETTHPHLRHAARPSPTPFAMCCAPKFIHGRAVEALPWMKLELIFREVLSRNRTFQSLEWWD